MLSPQLFIVTMTLTTLLNRKPIVIRGPVSSIIPHIIIVALVVRIMTSFRYLFVPVSHENYKDFNTSMPSECNEQESFFRRKNLFIFEIISDSLAIQTFCSHPSSLLSLLYIQVSSYIFFCTHTTYVKITVQNCYVQSIVYASD